MKIWSAKCDVRVFSEKMKKASIHREIEYVVFMKSNIFASSQRPRARAHNPDAIDENFRCNTVDLPHRGILVGFIFLSSKPHRHRPELPGRCIRRLLKLDRWRVRAWFYCILGYVSTFNILSVKNFHTCSARHSCTVVCIHRVQTRNFNADAWWMMPVKNQPGTRRCKPTNMHHAIRVMWSCNHN